MIIARLRAPGIGSSARGRYAEAAELGHGIGEHHANVASAGAYRLVSSYVPADVETLTLIASPAVGVPAIVTVAGAPCTVVKVSVAAPEAPTALTETGVPVGMVSDTTDAVAVAFTPAALIAALLLMSFERSVAKIVRLVSVESTLYVVVGFDCPEETPGQRRVAHC